MPVKKIAAPKVAEVAENTGLEVSYNYGNQIGKYGPYVGIKIKWNTPRGEEKWISITKSTAAAYYEVLQDEGFLADLADLAGIKPVKKSSKK